MVRAVESTRLSDLGRRFRLVTESCFDTGFSCLYLEGSLRQESTLVSKPPSRMVTFAHESSVFSGSQIHRSLGKSG